MYTFEWIPKSKDDKPAVFSGSVTINVPKHSDRMKFIKNLNTTINENGELVESNELDRSQKILEFTLSNITKIDLVRISDGTKIDNSDWLQCDLDGETVLGEIAVLMIQGVRLGKS